MLIFGSMNELEVGTGVRYVVSRTLLNYCSMKAWHTVYNLFHKKFMVVEEIYSNFSPIFKKFHFYFSLNITVYTILLRVKTYYNTLMSSNDYIIFLYPFKRFAILVKNELQ